MMKSIEILHLPKVGDVGLAIESNHLTGDWSFDNIVRNYMRRNDISTAWFQTYDKVAGGRAWRWTHGLVELTDTLAKITQFG